MAKDFLKDINKESADAICAKIKEDADSEIKSIMDRAQKQAAYILEEANKSAGRKKEDSLALLNKDLQKLKEKVLSTLNLERKRIVLEEKSKFVDSVIEMVKEKAAQFRKTPEYKDFLLNAVIEGMQIIESSSIEVYFSFSDEGIFGGDFMDKIKSKCSIVLNKDCSVKLNKSDFKDLGVIVHSQDGRMMYDNRFLSRMGRIYERLYIELLKEA